MEGKGKGEVSGQTFKVIESLKKMLLHEESCEKSVSSEEICLLFSELIKSVSSIAYKTNSSHAISQTIEILTHACSNPNHHIRGAASENMKKMIKDLMGSHFVRIQQDLFHELKKNGESRSLCIALECFSSLFPFTRPSRCSTYAQNLVPVFLRLISRQEESIHEALQDALLKIIPTIAPFMSVVNIKSIGEGLLNHLNYSSPSYRRMASSSLANIVKFSRNLLLLMDWLMKELFEIGCEKSATSDSISAVLMTLQQLFQSVDVPFLLLKQAYCYIVSCLLYQDMNLIVSGLECLNQLLNSTNDEFILWLISPLPSGQVAVEFWCTSIDSDNKNDLHLLKEDLDTPCDHYFEVEKNGSQSPISEPIQDKYIADSAISALLAANCCMAIKSKCTKPLENLIEYLKMNILGSQRVSAQSLALACITCAVDIHPSCFISLESILTLMDAQDPKIRSSIVKLLATIISSQLRLYSGNFNECHPVISAAYNYLFDSINDSTPIVLKSVCEALRLCLPILSLSTQPNKVVDILHKLLPLSESPYWLTKVELLQTLGCLNFTILALLQKKMPEIVLNGVVFKLIGDNDYRVRNVACECLISLASCMTLDSNSLLSHIKMESAILYSHLNSTSIEFSFAGIADTLVKQIILPPIGLDHILWYLFGCLSSSMDLVLQKGCLEALHMLSIHYPPASLADQWGCNSQPCTIIKILLQLLESSRLAWGVQGHSNLLELSGSIFLSCGLVNMQQSDATVSAWGALGDQTLTEFAGNFLSHVVKLLCMFVHIIEEREPEVREKKIQLGVSPKKLGTAELSSKPKTAQLLQDSLIIKPPIVPKDGLGYFANLPHFMKLYDACRAAYRNFQVSLAPVGTDKFSNLLQVCHKCLATLLEVALANDVGKHVEEMLFYLGFTVKIDPSGALLCVQQLLNALFGMNIAAQHTHLYSPFISSLNFNIGSPVFDSSDGSLHSIAILNPIKMMMKWLETSSLSSAPVLNEKSKEDGNKYSFIPIKKALVMKPANSVSEIKDYITYFEPLVIYALNQFPYTSSLLLQQRVLFLLVQLLHLKVRYDLLDCNRSFFESVMKLIGLMETGMVKGGEALIPHLFQFLVLLASDQSKLVSIPQVMQMCDGVMASGHNVTTFAIPALQPLVLHLFVRSIRLSPDVDIQREVVLNMLLRLIEHPRVIVLLTHVLDCYKKKESRWQEVSNKIYAALLPHIGKLKVVLDSHESLFALYQLFMAMYPNTVNIQGLMTALQKQTTVTSFVDLQRWLAVVCVVLELMGSLFTEKSLPAISSFQLGVPEFRSPLATVDSATPLSVINDELSYLAWFFRSALLLSADSLYQVNVKRCNGDHQLLSMLTANMLILLQALLPDKYQSLKRAFSVLSHYDDLTESFLRLSTLHPLLTLHYINFIILINPSNTDWITKVMCNKCCNSSSLILQHGTILSVCFQWKSNTKDLLLSIAKSPALSVHSQSNITREFFRCVQNDTESMVHLFSHLKLTGKESPSQLLQYLYIASRVFSPKTIKFLCTEMISHPLSVIGQAAVIVVNKLIDEGAVVLNVQFVEELLQDLKLYRERCPELILKLYSVSGHCTSDLENQVALTPDLVVNKDWYIEVVGKFCKSSGTDKDNEVCMRILSFLENDDLQLIFDQAEFPLSLLENCIIYGVYLSLNFKNFDVSVEQVYVSSSPVHPLLEISVKQLLIKLKSNPLNCDLTRCCVRLLAAIHQFPKECLLDAESIDLLKDFSLHAFKIGSQGMHPLEIQNSLDFCTLALHLSEIQEAITEEWANEAVTCLYHVIKKVYPDKLPKTEFDQSFSSEYKDLNHTKRLLLVILSFILDRELAPSPHTLQISLESFIFTLCRLSIWHGLVITPPVLKDEGNITYKVLDEALMESEVLLEYMQRCNTLGWLTRSQFEERWMQLLGVINQPAPSENANPEEYHAHSLNVCAGLQAITSLLLGTMLRPHLGDPTSSVFMSTYRNTEMLFLGSRPGRKLANIRKRVELNILLECAAREDLYCYYQSPLLNHYSSSLYPPLYTRNIEKEIGTTAIGYGQVSLSSLWPVMFKQIPSGYHSNSEDIDIKSCIISLIDLYIHWLMQPVHTVLLSHILQSIVMLSDLFAVSSQFDWMLHTLLDLYDNHPFEDIPTTSLIIVGILKAAAVLKSAVMDTERIIKIIEKALTSDVMIQIACVRGILYLSEDSSSSLMPQCIPSLTKYIITRFQNFKSYTEEYLMTLWSLTVKIITDHSQHIKDQNFTSKILELISQLMLYPDISSVLFHSITLGLEMLVLNFSLSAKEKASVISSASNRFVKSDQSKSLAGLSLLLSCMYTGEEANVASGLAEPSMDPMETAIQAREQVNNLMERLRHGPEISINIFADIIPHVIIDFLPPMEVLQTVVTDFVSPHQSRPQLSATIMAETFGLLLKNGHRSILDEWIILSLESFVQQEPETRAVWSITCLLLAASTDDACRSIFPLVCYWKQLTDSQALQLLCMASRSYYANQVGYLKVGIIGDLLI